MAVMRRINSSVKSGAVIDSFNGRGGNGGGAHTLDCGAGYKITGCGCPHIRIRPDTCMVQHSCNTQQTQPQHARITRRAFLHQLVIICLVVACLDAAADAVADNVAQ